VAKDLFQNKAIERT